MEGTIYARAIKTGDAVIAALVSSAMGIVFRSIKTSELAGLLNRFSDDHKKVFQQRMAASPQAETSYNSIVAQRHNIAHTSNFTLTFDEFVRYYETGHVVLDVFREIVDS